MKYFYILLSECNTTLFRSFVVVVLVVMVRFCTIFPTFPLFLPPKWCIRELPNPTLKTDPTEELSSKRGTVRKKNVTPNQRNLGYFSTELIKTKTSEKN